MNEPKEDCDKCTVPIANEVGILKKSCINCLHRHSKFDTDTCRRCCSIEDSFKNWEPIKS